MSWNEEPACFYTKKSLYPVGFTDERNLQAISTAGVLGSLYLASGSHKFVEQIIANKEEKIRQSRQTNAPPMVHRKCFKPQRRTRRRDTKIVRGGVQSTVFVPLR